MNVKCCIFAMWWSEWASSHSRTESFLCSGETENLLICISSSIFEKKQHKPNQDQVGRTELECLGGELNTNKFPSSTNKLLLSGGIPLAYAVDAIKDR